MLINSIKLDNINLDFVKNYLRIDEDFTEDDKELELYMLSARSYIENYLNCNLSDFEGINPELNIAFLMLINHFYENKTAVANNSRLDFFFRQILTMHRNFL